MPAVAAPAGRALAILVLATALAACSTAGAPERSAGPTAPPTAPDSTRSATDQAAAPADSPSGDARTASGIPAGRYTCWDISNPSTPPALVWDMWVHDDGTYSTLSDTNRWRFTYDPATKRVDFPEGAWAERGYFGDFRAAGDIVYDRVNGKTKIMMHDPALEASVGGNRDLISCDLADG